MEANEAPKKIYIPINNAGELGFLEDYWYEHSISGQEVEYIRADVFIDKARKYIANHFLSQGMDYEINDFVNYMKGE